MYEGSPRFSQAARGELETTATMKAADGG